MTTFTDPPLEEQIAQWREYLRRRRAVQGPDVEELEGHLRDQLVALVEAGLTGDEAFLVAVKRMRSLDALSREFAHAHSERLWKQLVMDPDAADAPATAAPAETLVVLSLAVAAALAVKVPTLFGHPLNPNDELPWCSTPRPRATRRRRPLVTVDAAAAVEASMALRIRGVA